MPDSRSLIAAATSSALARHRRAIRSANTTARPSRNSTRTTESGDEIVNQFYNFADKGDRKVSLRPEMTPTLARWPPRIRATNKPIKWFSIPQLRYERQQKGRLREHCSTLTSSARKTWPQTPIDALLIDTLRDLKLSSDDLSSGSAADAPGRSSLKTAVARNRTHTTFTRSSTNWSAKIRPSPARNWPSLVFRTTR